ncbi:uncharacterized protein [Asterias amurensis]|uniref:uncharacterized protein isoform X4 n=1 Tax=Asterias amurensis TaxID=7602 RepID=UPI003AB6111F
MANYTVVLEGGSPWGFRLKGGRGTGIPLVVSKINPGSKAAVASIHIGDSLEKINGQPTYKLDQHDALNLIRNTTAQLELVLSKPPPLNGPLIINNNNNMSAQTSSNVTEIPAKPVGIGRVRKSSRGAEMFFARQAEQGIARDPDSPDEPPPPRMLTNNNQYPTSPTSPTKHHPNNNNPTSPKHQNYSQSPPKQDTYYQPVRPQRADSGPDQDSWPAPPPPLTSVDSKPQFAGAPPPNPGWSPPMQPNPVLYQPTENKSPSAWTPALPNIKPVKEFRPVKLDLNSAPKPWKAAGAPQIERTNEPAPTSSSQPSTWQSPPPQRSTQQIGPVTNGELHPSNEALGSPYRPGDPQHDQDRYNPGYRPNEPQQRQPLSPQESRRPELRPAPEGYSSGLPRSVSPTVTLLQYQRERDKDGRSQADYIPPDKSLMPPPSLLVPSAVAKEPAVAKPLHAGSIVSVVTDPNDLPEGAVYQKQIVDGDVIHTDTYYPVKTREVTKKTTHKEAPHYEGIGPQDESGLPVGLRAHVKEENRHDWYKEMFKTIHKQDRPEDDIDLCYMDALMKEANTYEPSYHFPDEVACKDNDDNVFEEERPPGKDQWSHDPTVNSSPPTSPPQRHVSPNTSARNTIDRYHQQPRSIIDYEPGTSSLAERDKSPTSHLYNPPVEPITAVQNTKRSTTLPRDFASFNQVPAESPSSRHASYNEPPSRSPKRGTNASVFSTNPNPINQSASDDCLFRLGYSASQSIVSRRSVHHLQKPPCQDLVLDSNTEFPPKMFAEQKINACSGTETIHTGFLNQSSQVNRTPKQEKIRVNTFIDEGYNYKCFTGTSSKSNNEMSHSKPCFKPPPGVFRKPRLDLGGAPTPVRPNGAIQSEPEANSNVLSPCRHSIQQQVDNNDNEGSNQSPSRFGPRGMADGCPGVEQTIHSGTTCVVNDDDQVKCLDDDTGEIVQSRCLPRPTSLFEPYSLEREQERSSNQPSSASPRSDGFTPDLSSRPRSDVRSASDAERSSFSMDSQSDRSGRSGDDDEWGAQRPGSVSPDQLVAEGEQKHKRSRVEVKHQKLKHIKKHRSERRSPKDDHEDMVPYSERPNARNFAPMENRRAISAENLSMAVKSPAFNQESYQKYATGLKKASQQSKTYEDLVQFYSKIKQHLESEEKAKVESMKEKYMPKPAQLEVFYRTLQYYSELEMAIECGEDMTDKAKHESFRWNMGSDVGLKKREKDIFELYDFYEKLERGAIGTPTGEERLEQIRMKTYLQKAKELETRQLRVGQLYSWYENMDSKGSTTPSFANSQVASLKDFDSTDGQSEEVGGGLPTSYSPSSFKTNVTESRVPSLDPSLADLEALIPRVPLVDPPLESFRNTHQPLGKASTLPRLYSKKSNRTYSPVPMPSFELSKYEKSKADDQMDITNSEAEVKREEFNSSLSEPPRSWDKGDTLPGRKTPPFMVTGRPTPVTRRKSFDKAIEGKDQQQEEVKRTGINDGPSNSVRKGPGHLSDLASVPVNSSHEGVAGTSPASPREEVVRPGSPEARAPPKLPERSMSTGVLGITHVIGPTYNPGLGRLQRWNRADLSQIEDEDLTPVKEVPSPAESRSRAPPIGKVGKMQSESSLPTAARGAGKSLAKNGMKKFVESQNELSSGPSWGDFNSSPQPFKPVGHLGWQRDDTDRESSLASFDLEPIDGLTENDGVDTRSMTFDPFGRVSHRDMPTPERINTHQFHSAATSETSSDQQFKGQSLNDSSSLLDHKSKIQLFEEKIVEQSSAIEHQPVPTRELRNFRDDVKPQPSPVIPIRTTSENQVTKVSSKAHGGLVIGIFSKPQPKQEEPKQEEPPTIWPPTPSPQLGFYTPPGESSLTQSLPRNFQLWSDQSKGNKIPLEGANLLRSTSASADCAGVDWSTGESLKVIKRYAFSTDEVYEERTPVVSRNVSPVPPSMLRNYLVSDSLDSTVSDRTRIASPDKPHQYTTEESTYYHSSPVNRHNRDSEQARQTQKGQNTLLMNALPLQNLDAIKDDRSESTQDAYTPSCSYSPSSTLSQDYTDEISFTLNQFYSQNDTSQGSTQRSQLDAPPGNWAETESENVFFWDTYIPEKYDSKTASPKRSQQQKMRNLDSTEHSRTGNHTPTGDWVESYSTLQALSPEPPECEDTSSPYYQPHPNPTKYSNHTTSEHPQQNKNTRSKVVTHRTDSPSQGKVATIPQSKKAYPVPPPKYPRGHPVDKWHNPVVASGYQSPRPPPFYQGDALAPQKSSTLPQQRKSPRMKEEPIRSSSRPQSSTLPRAKSKPRPDSSGLSAAERLGIKSPPPQRTQSTGSKPTRHSSGSDKIYNYRDPPPTLDKTKAERLIEEERKKKERLQLEDQQHRRHSDYAPIKSPIITNERFNDPIISSKEGPQPGRKQEVKACALALYPFKAQSHKELSFDKGDTIYLLRKIDKNWYEGEHHGHAGIFPSSYIEVVTSLEDAKKAQLQGPGLEGKARAKYKFSGETQTELNFNKGEYIELVKKIDANWWEGRIGNRKGIFPSAYVEVLREPTGAISPPAVKSPPPTGHAPIQPFSQQPLKSSPPIQKMSQTLPSKGSGRSSLGSAGSQGSYGSSQRQPDRYFEQRSQKPSKTLAAGQDFFVASFAYAPQNEDEIELQEGDLVNVLEKCDDGWFVGMSERTGMFGTFPGNYVYKYVS